MFRFRDKFGRTAGTLALLAAVVLVFSVGGQLPIPDIGVLGSSQTPAGARVSGGCNGPCTPSGPIDLSGQSGVVLENVHISNPNGRCLTVDNASNITIRNSVIGPCGTVAGISDGYATGLITVRNSSNVRFEANLIEDMASKAWIAQRNNAVYVSDSPNVVFVDNTFRDIHSDISQKADNKGNRAIAVRSGSPGLVVTHNTFTNAGRNAVQYQRNKNVSGVEISYNVIEGRGPWDSDYEDMINLYASTGTSSSPIQVVGNYFRWGGPSNTGTGLIVGDGNTSEGSNAHVVVADNVMVQPGHVGIGIAGGSNLTIRNNKIYSDPDPRSPHTAVGMYINYFSSYGSTCDNISVTGNRVWFGNSHLGSGTNHVWNSGTCWGASLSGNVFGDTSLSASIWTPAPAAASAPATTTSTTAAPTTTTAPSTTASTAAPSTTNTTASTTSTTAAPTTSPKTTVARRSQTTSTVAQTASSTSPTTNAVTSTTGVTAMAGAEEATGGTSPVQTSVPASTGSTPSDDEAPSATTTEAESTDETSSTDAPPTDVPSTDTPSASPSTAGDGSDIGDAPDTLALVEIDTSNEQSSRRLVVPATLTVGALSTVAIGLRRLRLR